MRRAVCVCEGGNTRSVTLARLLRNRGWETIPCGAKASAWSLDTLELLFGWAEVIFPQKEAMDVLATRDGGMDLLQRHGPKMNMAMDVGVDDWNVPMADELVMLMRHKLHVAGL